MLEIEKLRLKTKQNVEQRSGLYELPTSSSVMRPKIALKHR